MGEKQQSGPRPGREPPHRDALPAVVAGACACESTGYWVRTGSQNPFQTRPARCTPVMSYLQITSICRDFARPDRTLPNAEIGRERMKERVIGSSPMKGLARCGPAAFSRTYKSSGNPLETSGLP